MRTPRLASSLVALLLVLISAIAPRGAMAAPILKSIVVTPDHPHLGPGESVAFTATGRFSDGSSRDITRDVVWSSTKPDVATVNAIGVALTAHTGATKITAKLGNVSGDAQITVAPPERTIVVTPANPNLSPGATLAFTATEVSTNGQTKDVTTKATWSSSNAGVASVNGTGLATALADGQTQITARQGSTAGSTILTVSSTVISVDVTPSSASILAGATQGFTARATYSGGSTQDVTALTFWQTFDTNVAVVDSPGSIRGVAPGDTYVMAIFQGQLGFASLHVSPPTLVSIDVTPNLASIGVVAQQQFSATGHYSNGTTADLTGSVAWSSSVQGIATIDNAGLAKSYYSVGDTAIAATLGALSDSSTLSVTVPPLTRFVYATQNNRILGFALNSATGTLTPVPGSPFCCTQAFGALVQDPLGRFLYASNASQILGYRIDPATGTLALIANPVVSTAPATDLAIDPTGRFLFVLDEGGRHVLPFTIDANSGLLSQAGPAVSTGSGPVAIAIHPNGHFMYVPNFNDGTISGYAIDPVTGALAALSGSPFAAGGNVYPPSFTIDGAHLIVPRLNGNYLLTTFHVNASTGALTLGSTLNLSPSVGSVSRVLIHPAGQWAFAVTQPLTGFGSSIDTFAIDAPTGALTPSGALPISSTNVSALSLDPTAQFMYLAGYFDSSLSGFRVNPISGAATALSDSPYGAGLFWFEIAGTNGLQVSTATLDSIEIAPSNATTFANALGGTYQFAAIGHYNDGSTRFLTNSVAWDSLNPSVATITTGAIGLFGNVIPGGVATALAYGTTTVTASFAGIDASTNWTIVAPPLVSIAVTPAASSLTVGTGIQLHAVGTYADSSTLDITSLGTWSSGDSGVATAAATGFVTTVGAGDTTISITLDGVVGQAAFDVVALTPTSPRFVYATENTRILGFVVDQATGALTPVPGTSFCCIQAFGPLASDPLGRFLYTNEASQLRSYVVDQVSGTLTQLPPTTLEPLVDLAVDPTGKFLYALGLSSTVYSFSIDPVAGTLTPAGLPVTAGSGPVAISMHPSGKFLYVPNFNTGTISGFAIDSSTGALTALAGSPFVTIGNVYEGSFTTDGAHMIMPRYSGIYVLTTFDVNAVTGALTAGPSLNLSPSVGGVSRMLVHPGGQRAYAVLQPLSGFGSTIAAFDIDPVTGGLTPTGVPLPIASANVSAVTLDPSGRWIYLAGYFDSALQSYTVDPVTGAVSPSGVGPFGSGLFWFDVVVSK